MAFILDKIKNYLNCQMSPVIILWPNTLKGTAKAPAVDILRLNTLRGTETAPFLTPQRVRRAPPSLLYGSPPPRVISTTQVLHPFTHTNAK